MNSSREQTPLLEENRQATHDELCKMQSRRIWFFESRHSSSELGGLYPLTRVKFCRIRAMQTRQSISTWFSGSTRCLSLSSGYQQIQKYLHFDLINYAIQEDLLQGQYNFDLVMTGTGFFRFDIFAEDISRIMKCLIQAHRFLPMPDTCSPS